MSQKSKKSDSENTINKVLLATAIIKLLTVLVDLLNNLID